MSTTHKHLLDTNVFLEASRGYYAHSTFPCFWKFLFDGYKEGHLLSIDKVRDEIKDGQYSLSEWLKGHDLFVASAEKEVVDVYKKVVTHVQEREQFLDAAKSRFLGGADAWLVAYAKAHGYKLVTMEVLDPNIRKRIPLPNVCRAFGITYVNTFQMLRDLDAKFE